jgi:Xaa-Pro aminopeptidase
LDVFVGSTKLSREIMLDLTNEIVNIYFHEYEDVYTELSSYVTNNRTGSKIWLSKSCNYALASLVPDDQLLIKLTPISLLKATKNPTEIAGMKRSFIRDAAAVTSFYAWLENAMRSGINLTEISAADKLYEFRSKARNFVSLSFKTISGSGPNGAIVHYWPTVDSDRPLSLDEMYLVDSGAHYFDGTTDVTRTFHFGEPTDYQKDCFTRVLKGQIAMATLKFPWGVTGHTIDSFARRSLWEVGLDFAHGTGHGIGSYLNVGEGAQSISYAHNPDDPGLRENMIVSNEPGYYEEGNFGIRLENAERIMNSSVKNFLEMEDLTFVPYQQSLIKLSLLTDAEIEYLNTYYWKCRDITGNYMREYPLDNGEGLAWLERETQPLRRP